MLTRGLARLGAVAAIVGTVIGIVFNLLHPRPDELTAAAAVRSATTEDIWILDHYMLGLAIGLGFLALVVIGRSFVVTGSVPWARVAVYAAIGSSAIGFATIGVDGFAIAQAAEVAGEEAAVMVAYVGEGLLLATIGSLFGITPVLFGVAVLTGDDYPGWLGWVAVLAGAIGIVNGSLIFFNGFTALTINTLFPIGSVLYTLWIGIMGLFLWRKAAAMPATA